MTVKGPQFIHCYFQIIIFGYFVCLDSFLYTFTILPLRFAIALKRWVASYFKPGKRRSLPVSAKCDLAKFSIFLATCLTLHHITDASKMYHSVRGQEVIKLYVIFNVLEVSFSDPADVAALSLTG